MSYGTNAPQGMKPSSFLDGSLYNGQLSSYNIASGYNTPLFTNDPVTLLNDGTIGIGVPGSQIIGSFQGCKFYAADGTFTFSPYWAAGTNTQNSVLVEALVADAPGLLYDMQVSRAGAAPQVAPSLLQADMGLNINFRLAAVGAGTPTWSNSSQPNNPGGGSTRTGQSGYYLDYESIANTSTLNFKLIRLTPVPGNDSAVLFNNALVLINANVYKSVGTAGV